MFLASLDATLGLPMHPFPKMGLRFAFAIHKSVILSFKDKFHNYYSTQNYLKHGDMHLILMRWHEICSFLSVKEVQ
jgi:hypothetical protein